MNERNEYIVSQVRLKLKSVSTHNLLSGDIYEAARLVQSDLMFDLKTNEISICLSTSSEEERYPIDQPMIGIKEILSPYSHEITFVPNKEWNQHREQTGTEPCFATIFGQEIYLSPIPAADDDEIIFWAFQIEPKKNMDDDTEPETPTYLDKVLIEGICAEFDDSFIEKYEFQKEKYRGRIHVKQTKNLSGKLNW